MLVLARKKGQSIMIGKDIKILVVEVTGETVRLGIEAPAQLEIFREEIYRDLQEENTQAITGVEEAIRLLKNCGKKDKKQC
ncbi:carbon storage regulator CsrA [Pelotomaculum propionicicum]|uniref:Translational regulator CsrA n=1 Tax=Pelotomaculum propionicicum TaxID=258475 RepID=A0A4Y7RQQ5_9FIRM|nr:carbon storage regulator CsrA [Pelotomaculum propionicicum]NLI13199.1 carbon storage regulator CsrA [Peptococcaceae bacterium]TEB11171.1 Carbon storage regulator [Pelotomaculum propionicicum]